MALADYIDRAATSASQLLANFELAPFLARLDEQIVGIGFDAEAAGSVEGRATLDLAVRLLARLYPTIAIVAVGEGSLVCSSALKELARSINPRIDLAGHAGDATVAMVVGNSPTPFGCRTIHVGSDGWRVRLSTTEPVGSGSSHNSVGAGAAACFAAANIFRVIFGAQLPKGDPDERIDLSMLTFTAAGQDETLPSGQPVDIKSAHLVGAGAIGNGLLWAVKNWGGLHGELHVVDHEDVDLTNLQRYALAGQDAVGTPKVELAAACLAGSSVAVIPHRIDWQGYVETRGDWCFDRVAVALDTARDRIAVQGSLPRWIVNAWTQETDLGVSRHMFGDGPCLACLYIPAGAAKDQDEIVAEELGMPDAKLEVRTLLQHGTPVDASFVGRVATALGVPFEGLSAFVGQPLAAFHQSAICGGLVMKHGGGKVKARAVVPMAFQSALAGIMLAAEVVKHAAGYPWADHQHADRSAETARAVPARSERARHQRQVHLCGRGFPRRLWFQVR